tara:strand:+ start:5664 stop:6086 length:423 start_codon:yes stop_codon:yes gene_type:complete
MKKFNEVCLHTDGGSRGNPGPSSIGIFITDKSGGELYSCAKRIGYGTNNRAEYKAIIKGLKLCKRFTRHNVSSFSDSKLVINQLNGIYKVKNPKMKKYYLEVKALETEFNLVTYTHVRRTDSFIVKADMLVNFALDELHY